MDDPRLDAIAAPEVRATLGFVRAQAGPVSADDVAAGTGVHRNVARSRLERLARAGLVTTSFERRSGRAGPGAGRPAKLYAVAPELEAIEFPRRHLAELVGLLAADLPRARLRAAGASFGRALALDAGIEPDGLDALRRGLGRLGFQVSVDRCSDDQAVLSTPTCPLRPVTVGRPELGELDTAMWAGLVHAALPAARAVSCDRAGCLDPHEPCRITVRF